MDLRYNQRIEELQAEIANLKKMNTEFKNANAKLFAKVEEYRNKEQTISSAIIASMEHAEKCAKCWTTIF